MKQVPYLIFCLLGIMLASCSSEQQPEPVAELPFDLLKTPVGAVDFPSGCNAEAVPLVERGVALLHHMMYDEANFVFGMADDVDPDCALAYWGRAMTIIHPLWPDVPTIEQHASGMELVKKSLALGGHSERENAYLETTRAYFDVNFDVNLDNSAALSKAERLARFEQAWKALSDAYPDDLEARAFYSLALRATANYLDTEFLTQKAAGKIAESVLAENPDHPGAHHYIIHAYDFPGLASKALTTAENYGKITPRVPHATHMMTHIYTRLGQWDKAIEWNKTSAETAWTICVQNDEINVHYTHALDYLAYAYLQTGDDQAALDVLRNAEQLQPPYSPTSRAATAYAFAALPARIALERRDWEAAAGLVPRTPASFPWEDAHDSYVAITHFARALAFAHLGKPDAATADIEALATLREKIAPDNAYWGQQVEIQLLAAFAWQTYAYGDVDTAIENMKAAAELESSTEKHAVTPGEVLPAIELYGDMLLDEGRFDEAIVAYDAALSRAPGRFNSLYGAGTAAIGAGDESLATSYFTELLALLGDAPALRDEIEQVRAYLN